MVCLGVEALIDSSVGSVVDGRIGLITNPSGVTAELTPTIDLLHNNERFNLDVLFAPQHGLRGNRQESLNGGQSLDEQTGLPVRTISDRSLQQLRKSLEDIDTLIYDMQDIGCRYYSYLGTLALALHETESSGTKLVVLDRPNPIAPLEPEGNIVPPFGSQSLEKFDLPIVHGMTVGEIAHYFNEEFEIGGDVEVIELDDWNREMWFDETELPWVLPSPNMPTLQTAILYPGTCFFEGTNLSEGRGTTKPFELVGAPWIDADEWASVLNSYDVPGVAFRPAYFTPMFSKHERKDIEGVQVHILDRDSVDPVTLGIAMLVSTFGSHDEAAWIPYNDGYFIDQLAGGSYLRKTINEAADEVDPIALANGVKQYWIDDLTEFRDVSSDYYLY